jgi:misacylated tRNA(Ala) deacylase
MQTRRLDQTDSYLREFEAQVAAIDDRGVALDRTAFYPGGGGQPADCGSLAGGDGCWQVARLAIQEGVVWHGVEAEPLPSLGTRVTGRLDWARRYDLMRTHTAMHILCGVVFRDHGARVTGGRMERRRGRLDFELASLSRELVDEIERQINLEVEAAREIRVAILPRAEAEKIPDLIRTRINLLPPSLSEIRIVHIVGLDLQADGGTHVANTREVGPLRVVSHKSKGRLNKRIEIELAELGAGAD